jgi:hypothetical protein
MLRELCALCGVKVWPKEFTGEDDAFIQLLGRQIYRKQALRA